MERELAAPQTQPELTNRPPSFPAKPEQYIHSKFLIERPESAVADEDFELLEPPENERSVRALARIGIEGFNDADRLPTPLTPDGLVDVPALIELVKSIVGERAWEAPFFDIHHLYWPCADYDVEVDNDELLDGAEYSRVEMSEMNVWRRFRRLEHNMIGVPRVFHDVVHAITLPPPRPSLEVMQREIRKERANHHLFRVAKGAISIRESLQSMEPKSNQQGEFIGWYDRREKRMYQNRNAPKVLERRRQAFLTQIYKAHKNGLINLSEFAHLEYVDRRVIDDHIDDVKEVFDDGVMVIQRKRVRKVELPVIRIARSEYEKKKSPIAA